MNIYANAKGAKNIKPRHRVARFWKNADFELEYFFILTEMAQKKQNHHLTAKKLGDGFWARYDAKFNGNEL